MFTNFSVDIIRYDDGIKINHDDYDDDVDLLFSTE
jgi:hypothetical protein